jgi:hypothetical protein
LSLDYKFITEEVTLFFQISPSQRNIYIGGMKPIGENMNIAQIKDRIDELEVEIEKLKDARGKMLARQVTSRADLQSEYETGAKLVAEALIEDNTDRALADADNIRDNTIVD